MILAVDIDNVLNRFAECVLDAYNNDSGDNLTISDITDYGMEAFVRPEYREDFHKYFLHAAQCAPAIPAAQEYLRRLSDADYQIFLVTSTTCACINDKAQWIKKYYPFIPEDYIVRLNHKTLFKCNVMVDDYPPNLIGGDYKRIIMDYPWNQLTPEVDEFCQLIRCSDWKSIYQTIIGLEEQFNEYY